MPNTRCPNCKEVLLDSERCPNCDGSVPEEDQSPAQDDESGNKKAPPDRWLGTSHNAGCLVFAMIVVVGSIILGKACTILTSR